ncbi:MAG: 4-hydroxy-3-methylbut-2-enyl diphosphate reductase, partial [Bacteroidales bacterium]|nr:4-hydroxy-3-methylbut-2-enyl diphosphate reductase [Bacteroidales bacterium]
ILFVSDEASSNGKMLYKTCQNTNPNTHFVVKSEDLQKSWFANAKSIGISGANSTPQWLLEEIKDKCLSFNM